MSAFTVSTDALRAVAEQIGEAATSATVTDATRTPSDTGHAALADAVASFGAHLDGTWAAQVSATGGVQATLERTAVLYENADGGGEIPRGATAF